MAIRICIILVLVVTVGCERASTAQTGSAPAVKRQLYPEHGGVHGQIGSRRERVEELLRKELEYTPVGSRYDAVLRTAKEMWSILDELPQGNDEYVILVAARFHQKISLLLSETNIPQKSCALDEPQQSEDGTLYRIASKEHGLKALEETVSINEARNCQMQLRHFLCRYPNGIDSVRMQSMFNNLPESSKRELMNRIVAVIGRKPTWAKDML